MTENHRQVRYSLRIIVEFEEEYNEPDTLLDLTSDGAFLSFHAGDKLSPRSLIPQGPIQPPPYMYNELLTVQEVRHNIWEFDEAGKPMLHHGIEVVLQDPYNI